MPNLPNWTLSQESRARMTELLKSAGDLGLDPEAVAAGGLAALQALIALKRAKDAGEGDARTQLLERAQDALRSLDPAVHANLLQQAQGRILALQGRGGDTEIVHVTPGEIVLPKALQTPAVLGALRQTAAAADIPLAQLRVGDTHNSTNPATSLAEFFETPRDEIEEIVITAPRDEVFVARPNAPLNDGRYDYGDPDPRFGRPATVALIESIASQRHAAGDLPIGVGNMSMNDGRPYGKHDAKGGHAIGTSVDIRPLRKDGKPLPVTWQDPAYDRVATQRLVDAFLATGGVDRIRFNDPDIKGASYWDGHDDHLHVTVNPKWKKP